MKKNHHRKADSRKARMAKTLASNDGFLGTSTLEDSMALREKSKIFSDILGFSDETLFPLYENAIALLQSQRLEESKAAFSFLTKINPYISEFWMGLGLSHMAEGAYVEALSAFLMALTMDPLLIEAYEYAIDCCIENNSYDQAQALVKQLSFLLKGFLSPQELRVIQRHIKKMEEKIALKKLY